MEKETRLVMNIYQRKNNMHEEKLDTIVGDM